MQEPDRRPSFWAELKRRRVYRVAVVYAVAAFGVWQVADILVPVLGLPDIVMKLVVIGPILTFPFAMVLAWAYDNTPDGIRPADEAASGTDGEAPAAAVPDGSRVEPSAWRSRPTPSVVRRAAIGTLAMAVLVAGGWWAVGSRLGGDGELSEVSLAVFPFTVRGGGMDYLKEGLVDLLSRNLTGASDLQPVDPSLVLKVTGGTDPAGAVEAGTFARKMGAGQFVTGAVSGASGRVRIDASLYALEDSVALLGARTVQGDTAQIFELIDELTAGLLSELRTGAVSERIVRTAATTTTSLPALKAYLEGEQAFRQGEQRDAADAFQRAIEADSSFALARYRLAMAYHMRGDHDAAQREIRSALRLSDRLNAHDREIMAAFDAFHAGAIADAERQLRSIVREYPRDLEARVILAELLMYYAPVRGEPLSEARRLLEDVLEADPKFTCVYCQLGAVLVAEGDIDGAERFMRLLEGQETGDTTKASDYHRFRFGALRGDSAAMWQALADMDTLPADEWLHMVVIHLGEDAISQGRFGEADEILRRADAKAESESYRADLQAARAMARGEWKAASGYVQTMLSRPDPPPVDRQVGSSLLWVPLDLRLDHLPRLRQGLVDSRLENAPSALAWADSLDALPIAVDADSQLIAGLAHVVRADVAVRRGDPETALRELDRVSTDVPPAQLAPWVSAPSYAGLVRVQACLQADQPDQALQWLRHYVAAWGRPDANLYGVYHRDMAYALDALGRAEEAAVHYGRFVEAWESADPELQPQVSAARQRLATLTGEGS